MAEDFKRLADKIARARQNAVDEIAEDIRLSRQEEIKAQDEDVEQE